MATNWYWVSKAPGGWSGSRGAGTATSPFDGALGVQAAFTAGTILPGDTVTMMPYGPVLHAEILADFPNTARTITQHLTHPGFSAIGTANGWDSTSGGITWGNKYSGASNCRDITFEFQGDYEWHIDARGATTNAGRMRAGLVINGPRNTVRGLRMASPNWCWITTPSTPGRVEPTGSLNSTYAAESSAENYGLVMNGGWGCKVIGGTFWGSDAFGRQPVWIRFVMLDTASQADTEARVEGIYAYGGYYGISAFPDSTNVDVGRTGYDRFNPEAGAGLVIYNNRLGTCRWGDTATTPVYNNAMNHAGHISAQTMQWVRGYARIHGNETWGDCQDSIEMVGANYDCYDNDVHDLCPLYGGGATYTRWYNNAGTWDTTTASPSGEGIITKNSTENGSIAGLVWPFIGTVSSASSGLPAYRCRIYRNRIRDFVISGTSGGIVTHGINGALIHANELTNMIRGIKLSGASAPAADNMAYHLTSNYVKVRSGGIAVDISHRSSIWMYNNIFDSTGGGGYDISMANAANLATLQGSNNRLVTNTVSLGAAGVNNLTGTTTGSAAYTEGVGPTAGGNCASSGSWQGVTGAKAICALRDLNGEAFSGTVPVGPYKP